MPESPNVVLLLGILLGITYDQPIRAVGDDVEGCIVRWQARVSKRTGKMNSVKVFVININLVIVKIGSIEGIAPGAVGQRQSFVDRAGRGGRRDRRRRRRRAADVGIPACDLSG